jgi:hypothetical protein
MLKEYSKLFQFELFEPEIQLEQFDSDYMLDLYLRDEVKGAEYVYNNIGYFIGRTKFRYISREEVLDKA